MPGPPPQPASLRILKGNGVDKDVAGRKVKRQPTTVNMRPPKPDLPVHGDELWELVTPELERMGLLGRIDLVALEAYCRTYHVWKTHDGGRGYPALTLALAKLGSMLGCDPASRLRMTLPEAEDDDDEEARVFGRR